MFSYKFCEIFKNTFFTEHLRRLLLNPSPFNKIRVKKYYLIWAKHKFPKRKRKTRAALRTL